MYIHFVLSHPFFSHKFSGRPGWGRKDTHMMFGLHSSPTTHTDLHTLSICFVQFITSMGPSLRTTAAVPSSGTNVWLRLPDLTRDTACFWTLPAGATPPDPTRHCGPLQPTGLRLDICTPLHGPRWAGARGVAAVTLPRMRGQFLTTVCCRYAGVKNARQQQQYRPDGTYRTTTCGL